MLTKVDRTPHKNDPLNVNARLYHQLDRLLDQLETGEHITLRERVQALIAVGRLQVMFLGLRKEKNPDDAAAAGSAVRKYSKAFTHASGRRKAGGRDAEPEPGLGEDADADAALDAELKFDDDGDDG
jgi:hypothetical protein